MAPSKEEVGDTKKLNPEPPAANGGVLKIPDWVTADRFVDILKETIKGFKKILKFEPALTGGGGENYASIMLRVKVKVALEGGSTKDVSYMIKTVPESEQAAMMINMMGLFPKESSMYLVYLPEFEQMYRDVGKQVTFGPKFHTFKQDPGVPYILLEDISPKGFKNADRLEGFDKDHTESVLKLLAELHAASAVRYAIKGDYDPRIMSGMFTEESRQMLEAMTKQIQTAFLECLSKYEVGARYVDKVKQFQDDMVDLFIKYGKYDPVDFNVLNHGDLWANNIMFRHNDEGKREETVFVDFQLSRFTSPTVDLYYFLFSSTNLDLKASHFDYFIKYYYDHLAENLKLLSYPKPVPVLKDLRMQLLKHSFWGFAAVTGIMAIALLDPSNDANIDNFMHDTDAGKQLRQTMFGNPRFVKHCETMLPWLETRGLLD